MLLAVFSTLSVVVLARNVAQFVSQVFFSTSGNGDSSALQTLPLVVIIGVGLLRGALIWLQEWLAITAANRAKAQLRGRLIDAIVRLGSNWANAKTTSELSIIATSRLEALDPYFAKFLPQLVYTAIITPVLTIVILMADPLSGIEVILTLPLVPIFMIFIGWATQAVQQKQLDATNRMSMHFTEVLRGVTTLRIFGRAERQLETIAKTSEQYRVRTLKVLRVSFLSGFALELIASLAVALVAVSIGLRLVDGDISFRTGLFVLLLAPEAFLPLRMVGAQFHASSEGVTASKQVLDIIDEAKNPEPKPDQSQRLHVSGIKIEDFAQGQITAIQGPSGVGKTTLLNTLRSALATSDVAWLPQNIGLLPGTVLQNIVGPAVNPDEKKLLLATQLAALDDISLDQQVGDATSAISGGQAQRVGLARAFYRVMAESTPYLLLDEPISALDQARVGVINASLRQLSGNGTTVIAVSHQPIESAKYTMVVGSE